MPKHIQAYIGDTAGLLSDHHNVEQNDIKKLASGTQHQQLHNQVSQNHPLSTFITTSQDSNANEGMAAELAQIYHAVHHEHCCRSLDCRLKLNVLYLMTQYHKKILWPYKIWSDCK
jgi:hypothetical protein